MHTALEILHVEDDETDIITVRRTFQHGEPVCNISVANDGSDALDFLHKRGNFVNAPTPQLILLDLNLPRLDGKAFLKIVKAEPQLKAIPVVVLTSSQSARDIRECYECYASGYVVKPFHMKEFASTAKQIVSFWADIMQLPA
jgi:CheY-like chemotaxis protein